MAGSDIICPEVDNTKDTKGLQQSTVSPDIPSAMVKVPQRQEQPEVKPKSLSLWKSLIYKAFSVWPRKCLSQPKMAPGAQMELPLPVERAAHAHVVRMLPGQAALKVSGETFGTCPGALKV